MATAQTKNTDGEKTKSKGGVANVFLTLLKFVVAFVILPVIIATTVAFQDQVEAFTPGLKQALWTGMVVYIILRFFVYGFGQVYQFGQQVVGFCFQFLKPLVNVAPYVVPIYTILALILYSIVNAMGKTGEYQSLFFSAFAFTFTMHIVLTAQDLYNKDSVPGKPTYFFGMGLVYIFDVFFIALLMNFTVPGFSFVHFFQSLAGTSIGIYKAVFHQLF